ncbi:MAG: NAD-dependent epimerase/dehydratase family protein, partial [Planctomycetota bacterium]|nr:NAD-dependent epimerase/dehydratase family protein [Planctomycetota bacterium]
MRVLVIGGTGHIGSHLVPRLLAAGHELTVIARHAQPRYADARLGWNQVRWI